MPPSRRTFPTERSNPSVLHCSQILYHLSHQGSLKPLQWYSGKESTCQYRRYKRYQFHPWDRKMPWRRKWQPTPVFLPGRPHGQRSLQATGLGV